MLMLNEPQGEFLSQQKKFNAFVGGYRSGKTFVGCVRQWSLALKHPGIKLGYFAPTYPMISDIFYPTIAEVGEWLGKAWDLTLATEVNMQRKEVKLFVEDELYSIVKCRSMEHAHRIVGFDISHAQVDEIDTMKKKKAEAAWRKIIARMSTVMPEYPFNTVDFTTTPEGFNFVYDLFVTQLASNPGIAAHYSITRASTRQNAKNLPEDYIQSLYDTYPSNLVDAYIDGEFVNLTSGTVYYGYNRVRNRSNQTYIEGETLYIGQDFNIGKMASTIYVMRGSVMHAVDEITEAFDTAQVIQIISERWPASKVIMYPDASGRKRYTNNGAALSDIALFEAAGYEVRAKAANPAIKDRVNASNKAFEALRVMVNDRTCPVTARSLEQQPYDANGMPEKDTGTDHQNDATTYPIIYEMPLVKPVLDLGINFNY